MDILLVGEFDAAELHAWRESLQGALPEARWLERDAALAAADTLQVAVVANPPPGSLQGLPRLRLIQSLWAGVERLLQDPTLPRGVPIARMVDPAMNAAMAETALWAVLSLHRRHFDYARAQHERRWAPLPQRRAEQVHVLVLGLGQMGANAARRIARQGYRVAGWSLRPRADAAALAGIDCRHGDAALPGLLARSDIVINLLPLTPATRGLLGARLFAALPRGAAVVNLARGAHVVDAELLAALDAGQLGHAVLDVFQQEPLPAHHPYWQHPRVTLLPHVAAQTDAASASQVVAANVRALYAGRPLAHLVDRASGY
ncbi:MAG TPA: glyoxylate/hydroxypyruvate reductase A [Rubrivivax sp.]|nr:glyoxylate/hydroxypyruvate reductase A [Rubrivivax sp.]